MALGVVYVSLTELGSDRVELCYWRDNENDFQAQMSGPRRSRGAGGWQLIDLATPFGSIIYNF